jgi:N-acetylmuramic acid 6-phosphate etherase
MIDRVSTLEMLGMINDEDAKAAQAVRAELPNIAKAVDRIAEAFKKGGRLFYVGAGTSGRVGILDASECPPTFGVPHGMVIALIAGGSESMFAAVEGAEDDTSLGIADMQARGVGENDVVVGISSSGRTPYVLAAIKESKAAGACTVGISNAANSRVGAVSDIAITPIVGPEALTGSTRMKGGTSQKMVLNMLSTGAMIRIGKSFGNLMVDVTPTSKKLEDRAVRIVDEATGAGLERSTEALREAGNSAKLAIVMLKTGLDLSEAIVRLEECDGFVSRAVEA